ncbi:MAG: spermidine synthase [Candidatus Zixiibacteriota bacterium]
MTIFRSESKTASLNAQLMVVSFLMLFAEIALIRWLSTEIRVLAYVNNLVLLSCFLGIGLGAFYSQRKLQLSFCGFGLAAQLLLVWMPVSFSIAGKSLHPFRDIPLLLSSFTDSVIWYESETTSTLFLTSLGLISTMVIFVIILLTFIPLGQLLGKLLDEHNNTIAAYSLNVLASIAGVWAFSICSFAYMPAWIWFVVALASYSLILIWRTYRSRLVFVSVGLFSVAILLLGAFPTQKQNLIETTWSPYQKLELYPQKMPNTNIQRGYLLNVNNVGYMGMLDLSDKMMRKYPTIFDISLRRFSQYDIPYLLKKNPEDVLILGAGAGNDASGALRNKAGHVDAVEIDPGIYRLGLQYHPERPYDDPRVNVVIDDARSFLKRSDKLYDIVSFGLLDAHTLSSSFNNMRIDHYVYTLESFREARSHLKEDGILTIAFEAQRPWIKQRLFNLLDEAFGFPPIAFTYPHNLFGWGGTIFVTALDRSVITSLIASDPAVERFVTVRQERLEYASSRLKTVKLTSDDWPYLYLQKPGIPMLHLSIMAIILIMVYAGRVVVFRKDVRLDYHFFLLGVAFLLLEFQNISKSSLLFGSTWLVNSFVITGILLLILAANSVVALFKVNKNRLLYILLIASSLVTYFLPLEIFSSLGFWQRAVVVSIILNVPIFFAGMIFVISFKKARSKDVAFGSNLLGAAVGGVLESLSFIVGINALLLIVVASYALSALFLKKKVVSNTVR